jgi:hypothetical protein
MKIKKPLLQQWKQLIKQRNVEQDSSSLQVENGLKNYNKKQLNIKKGGYIQMFDRL